MGKRYYTGVPGIHEQFGPVVASAVKGHVVNSTRNHNDSPVGGFLILLFLTLPLMSFWAGLMILREGFQILKTFPDSPERAQAVFNVKFATIFFFIGLFAFKFTIGRFI